MTSRLDIRIRRAADVPVESWPEVTLLVDGADVLADFWGEGMGRSPADMLGPDSPLDPDIPHDAPLMRCSCGDVGCGALVVRIRTDGDEVVWDTFRDGAASKSDRLSRTYDRLGGQLIAEATPIRFDAAQYRAEVRRAQEDHDWESPGERTARLVAEALRDHVSLEAETGWTLMGAWSGAADLATPFPHAVVEGIGVSLRNGERQVTLSYPSSLSDPVQAARRVTDLVLNISPRNWPVSFRGGRLQAWEEHPDL